MATVVLLVYGQRTRVSNASIPAPITTFFIYLFFEGGERTEGKK